MSNKINKFPFASESVALLTGAASGIGAAAARELSDEGVRRLVLVDRNAAGLAEIEAALKRQGAEVLSCVQDVADEAAWRATMDAVVQRFGRVDLILANAGIADAAPITEMDFAAWRRVLAVNLDGVFLTLKHGIAALRAGKRGGAVVVVSSAAALRAEVGIAAYGASKAAVVQLAKVAAKEGAADRIRVNVLLPGGVETPIWRDMSYFQDLVQKHGSESAALTEMGKRMPLGRYARADEIACHIAFMLSQAAGPMTGATVTVDSGYIL
jgi:2-keto-3-deoxy-L-fuconate dehydrogenase